MNDDNVVILDESMLQSLEIRLRPENRGMVSTCSEYTCDCHDDMPNAIATIRNLRTERNALAAAFTTILESVRAKADEWDSDADKYLSAPVATYRYDVKAAAAREIVEMIEKSLKPSIPN